MNNGRERETHDERYWSVAKDKSIYAAGTEETDATDLRVGGGPCNGPFGSVDEYERFYFVRERDDVRPCYVHRSW